MDTYQIEGSVLDDYKREKLREERVDFLIKQADAQIDEIAQESEIYEDLLARVKAPPKIDKLLLWILFMSNESICGAYIRAFKKDFEDMIPVSDLADLLLYVVHLEKVKGEALDGLDYLLEYEDDGLDEVDRYCFMNVLLFIQQKKEGEMQF